MSGKVPRHADGPSATPHRARIASTLLIASSLLATSLVATTSLGVLLGAGAEPALVAGALIIAATAVLQATTGSAIELRRPGHAIGRILLLSGPIYAVLGAGWTSLDAMRPHLDPVAFAIANWVVVVLSYPGVALVAGWLPLLFPTGTLPGPRWRWPAAAILVLSSLGLVALAVKPGPVSGTTDSSNPFGIEGWPSWLDLLVNAMMVELIALFVLAVAGLGVRYRRGDRTERLQIRWLLGAVAVVAAGFVATAVESAVRSDDGPVVSLLVAIGGILVMPIAIGIAVLRYRLYAIDRIISRTLGWALVTGLLVAVFVAGVVALQALLAGLTQGQTLAVAASTLLAFALFQPLRRRVQAAVDRRFDRARYDGERTVATFANRLRADVDLAEVVDGVLATVESTMRPTSATVWLRAAPEGGR